MKSLAGGAAIVAALLMSCGIEQQDERDGWGKNQSALGLTPVKVKDLPVANQGFGSTTVGNTAIGLNGRLMFMGAFNHNGVEPSISDGTDAGTYLLRDTRPGDAAFSNTIGNLTFAFDAGFFTGSDGRIQYLWRSDGTPSGTERFMHLGRTQGAAAGSVGVAGGKLIFTASTAPANGQRLWVSDGTLAGTRLVLGPSDQPSAPAGFVKVGDRVFFTSDITGRLWVTDGTDAGTRVVGNFGSFLRHMIALDDNRLFFFADTQNNNQLRPFVSDGTLYDGGSVGTFRLTGNFATLANLTAPAVANGAAYFRLTTTDAGTELWRSDGTTAGTQLWADIGPGTTSSMPTNLRAHDGTVYFSAGGLYRADPSMPGATKLTSAEATPLGSAGSSLYFTQSNQLWKTNGTPEGTVQVAAGSVNFFGAQEVGNQLYLFGEQSSRNGLYLVEESSTEVTTVFRAQARVNSKASDLFSAGGLLYFSAGDFTTGTELWRSDGTDAGTFRLTDFMGANDSDPVPLAEVEGQLVFAPLAVPGGLWVTNGHDGGLRQLASGFVTPPMVRLGDSHYVVSTFTSAGAELGRLNGLDGGWSMVTDLNPGSVSSSITSMVVTGGKILFSGIVAGQRELWATDGTDAGTLMLKNFNSTNSGEVDDLAVLPDGGVIFSAAETSGRQLQFTDGTVAGTRAITGGVAVTTPTEITVAGDWAYFAGTSVLGTELYRSDGVTRQLVKDIVSGTGSSSPTSLFAVNGRLYFVADDGTRYRAWISDGTAAGTVPLPDFMPLTPPVRPPSESKSPVVYRVGDGRSLGAELWRLDGTIFGEPTAHRRRRWGGLVRGDCLVVQHGRRHLLSDRYELVDYHR